MLERFLTALEYDTPPKVTNLKQLAMLQELASQKLISCKFIYKDAKLVEATNIRILRPKGPLSYPKAVLEDFYACAHQRLL